ncbi:NAD(P)H dehydrogenase [Thioalkalivibrio versutus]|uniref:NAD(P)H dehydrogenase n=1 Tax=Thioalkalivibrio versutus TaxID=106634 RepID=A0A0G3G535_9GAMM|nr:NAD(P)H-dependent oxidoreductase [Thioalkalivibrio versutus]AKJ95484.1 NAD(P)H dehydrogenase [Thioalkalivibrio versutus]
MKVLVILGHPRTDSLCGALAEAYSEGARAAGTEVQSLNLASLEFDPHVHTPSPNQQPLEKDLEAARGLVEWADHLVFVYPTWWGTMPALLKGFLDRIMTPEFAFRSCEGGTGYEGLLQGRSAQLITTMDTPPLIHRLVYRQPGANAMARATLGFCGVRPVRSLMFGSVRHSDEAQRKAWLQRARQEGLRLAKGRESAGEWLAHKAGAWLQALRLQFYPMTFVAYAVGALVAAPAGGVFGNPVFWLGYLCLFLLEVATVLVNERVDFGSDRQNRFYGPFTGGSRVLVEGLLSARELGVGIAVALVGFALAFVALLATAPGDSGPILTVMAVLAILAIGYTAAPLKLSYRGLGELDVALTHSLGVLLCGYVFLAGDWTASLPWLLSLPLFLAIVPSITLSGIPDREADAAVGKGTLAVRLGNDGALWVALSFTILAAASGASFDALGWAQGAYAGIGYVVVPYAAWLVWLLWRALHREGPRGRIDGLMAASLGYVLWFGLFPLVNLVMG